MNSTFVKDQVLFINVPEFYNSENISASLIPNEHFKLSKDDFIALVESGLKDDIILKKHMTTMDREPNSPFKFEFHVSGFISNNAHYYYAYIQPSNGILGVSSLFQIKEEDCEDSEDDFVVIHSQEDEVSTLTSGEYEKEILTDSSAEILEKPDEADAKEKDVDFHHPELVHTVDDTLKNWDNIMTEESLNVICQLTKEIKSLKLTNQHILKKNKEQAAIIEDFKYQLDVFKNKEYISRGSLTEEERSDDIGHEDLWDVSINKENFFQPTENCLIRSNNLEESAQFEDVHNYAEEDTCEEDDNELESEIKATAEEVLSMLCEEVLHTTPLYESTKSSSALEEEKEEDLCIPKKSLSTNNSVTKLHLKEKEPEKSSQEHKIKTKGKSLIKNKYAEPVSKRGCIINDEIKTWIQQTIESSEAPCNNAVMSHTPLNTKMHEAKSYVCMLNNCCKTEKAALYENQIHQLSKELAKMTSKLDEVTASYTKDKCIWEITVCEKDKDIKRYLEDIAAVSEEFERVTIEMDEIKTMHEKCKATLESAVAKKDQEIEKLNDKLEKLENALKENHMDFITLETSLTKKVKEFNDTLGKFEKANEENKVLKNELMKSEVSVKNLFTENLKLMTDDMNLTHKMFKMKCDVMTLTENVSSLFHENLNLKRKFKEMEAAKNKELSELREEIKLRLAAGADLYKNQYKEILKLKKKIKNLEAAKEKKNPLANVCSKPIPQYVSEDEDNFARRLPNDSDTGEQVLDAFPHHNSCIRKV